MKPMTKQVAIAAFILASVTVLSLSIRQVRLSAHRAKTIESPVIADSEDQSQSEQPLGANAEPDLKYTNASDWDEEAPSDDYSEAHTDSGKYVKTASVTKSYKGDYGKSEGSKGLQKISMGDYEDLYITGKGQLWYVIEQPDGSIAKMQVQIDDTTGEISIVESSDGNLKGLERISMGDSQDLYITGEGQLWYVIEQPDGTGAKAQVQIDETTGEITIVDSSDGGK